MIERWRASVTRNIGAPGLVRLFVTLSAEATDPSHPAHDWFVHRYRCLVRETAGLIEEAQRAGAIRADLPAAGLSHALIAVVDGLQVQWLLDSCQDMSTDFEAFLGLLGPTRSS